MKNQLLNQPHVFEKSVGTDIETVRSCRTGVSFLAHFVGLIQTIREHPVTAKWVKWLEEAQKRREIFNAEVIEALEEEWLFLWKKHPKLESKKMLILIKKKFTQSTEQLNQMPFDYACYLFLKFKKRFKCNECSEKFSEFMTKSQDLRVACDDKICAEYIQTAVELDPVYFWGRLCLLEKIYQFLPGKSHVLQVPVQGKWDETKNLHWERISSCSFQIILAQAQTLLWIRFEGDGFLNESKELPSHLDMVCKFSRTACESYLSRLLINIRSILPDLEQQDYGCNALNRNIEKKDKTSTKSGRTEKAYK